MPIDTSLTAMLEKVQNLLARADHPLTPPEEADTARTMAARIMKKYRLEEEEVRQSRIASGTAAEPITAEMIIGEMMSPYSVHYRSMFHSATKHVGVRAARIRKKMPTETGEERWMDVAKVVGFDTDIELARMLFMNCRLAFSEKLEPTVNHSLSDADNVYRLRSAGIERIRIAQLMWGRGDHQAGIKVGKLYKEACAARGEDPKVSGRSVNAKTFRSSYADGFASEIETRFRRMRMTEGLESGAVVLAGREEAVDEAFYKQFPALRPVPLTPEELAEIFKPCPKCHKAQSGVCRDHRIPTGKPKPYSSAGWASGTYAARDADLSRAQSPTTSRLEA